MNDRLAIIGKCHRDPKPDTCDWCYLLAQLAEAQELNRYLEEQLEERIGPGLEAQEREARLRELLMEVLRRAEEENLEQSIAEEDFAGQLWVTGLTDRIKAALEGENV